MRGQKSAGNPSQDSAFGSMTDGEQSIASSSFRLSSFQSISSPIDEGVEDVSSSLLDLPSGGCHADVFKDSADSGNNIARSTSDSAALQKGTLETAAAGGGGGRMSGTSATGIAAGAAGPPPQGPPTILVNDQSSHYTTSPSKTCNTVEVFSQKYRVSSFEDMSVRRVPLKSVNKLAFRSLEEERRIDSAFRPSSPASSMVLQQPAEASVDARGEDAVEHAVDNSCPAYNSEKFKKLTHAAFSRKITSTKERHTKWKNSIVARKNVMIKSNESLVLDHHGDRRCGGIQSPSNFVRFIDQSSALDGTGYRTNRMQNRVASSNELFSRNGGEVAAIEQQAFGAAVLETSFGRATPRKSHSERQLLTLCNFRPKSFSNEYDAVSGGAATGFGAHRSDIVSFIDDSGESTSEDEYVDDGCRRYDNEHDDDEIEDEDHSSSSNSHRNMCQIIGGCVEPADGGAGVAVAEENRPLLDGMEMSPISPVECCEML